MKNPIKLWKEPIKTVAEAETRKKDIIPWLIISIVVAVVFSALGMIPGFALLTILGLVGIFAVMIFGFLLFVTAKAKEKFQALTCDKCNKMVEIKDLDEYAKFVSYTVTNHNATYKGINHPASDKGVVSYINASGSASAVVLIDLKCPHCGNVKKLEYHVEPFKCSAKQNDVAVCNVEIVKSKLEKIVTAAVDDYNNPAKRSDIPYSIHSVKHPDYENRAKPKLATSSAYPDYNGAKITYHKDVEEMVEQFFVHNQLDGKIVDPNKPKKSK